MNTAPEQQEKLEALDVVLFSVGGWRAGFEASRVRAARDIPAENAGEAIETLLGFPLAASTLPRQHLLLKQAAGDRGILVGRPLELVSLPVAAIHPLPPLLARRTTLHGLRALAIAQDSNEQRVILLFDPACCHSPS